MPVWPRSRGRLHVRGGVQRLSVKGPELITERDQIRTVADRWGEQYGKPYWKSDERKQEIGRRLAALDKEKCSAADVAAIIGNDSWSLLQCDNCEAEVTAVVRVGDEPDYDSRTVTLCKSCAVKAVEAFA